MSLTDCLLSSSAILKYFKEVCLQLEKGKNTKIWKKERFSSESKILQLMQSADIHDLLHYFKT